MQLLWNVPSTVAKEEVLKRDLHGALNSGLSAVLCLGAGVAGEYGNGDHLERNGTRWQAPVPSARSQSGEGDLYLDGTRVILLTKTDNREYEVLARSALEGAAQSREL